MCNRIIRSLLLAVGMLFLSTAAFGQVGVSITVAPPELETYSQPICPGDGYIWTPGYWAWNESAYYWAPGLWVMAPEAGFLWTPGYWGWGNGGYFFNEGYWGTSVGFYGGINYGFGYFGHGYEGGRWDGGHFFYNTSLNNVNRNQIHNVYNTRVNGGGGSRVSYNGGAGGVNARATSGEEAAGRERHVGPVAAQTQHVSAARSNPEARSGASRGTASAGATGTNGTASHSNTAVHPRDLPAIEHPAAPNTGNAKRDQTYQKQQDKLVTQQNRERQNLQQRQDTEHQQLSRQKANEGRTQQVEQRHSQQTQQMQQRHTQQTQHLQQRSSGGGGGSHQSGHK
jgi:hypothetical protein